MKKKNILTILWTLAVMAFLIWFFTNMPKRENEVIVQVEFDKPIIDTILSKYDYILLAIGRSDCPICDIIISDMLDMRKYNLFPYYIQCDENDYNFLLSQVLRNKSFPTSYLIDKNGDIISIINGTVDYCERVENALFNKDADKYMPDQNQLSMLNYSFKAFLCHREGNTEQTIVNLEKSFSYGNYFFNNFLMSSISAADSSRHYVIQAVESLSGGDWTLYQNLIENDPNIKIKKTSEYGS